MGFLDRRQRRSRDRSCSWCRRLSLALGLLVLSSTLWGQTLQGIFAPYDGTASTQVLSRNSIGQLLAWAAAKGANVFDLLDEAGLALQSQGLRLTVRGNDLRAEVDGNYNLGGPRVDALFPLATLDRLTLGGGDGKPAVEVFLTEPHSGFLELGNFALQTHYGFWTLGPKSLDHAFGVKVSEGWWTFDLAYVARVPDPTGKGSPNFIAIHLKDFPKPKQWWIAPIQRLP